MMYTTRPEHCPRFSTQLRASERSRAPRVETGLKTSQHKKRVLLKSSLARRFDNDRLWQLRRSIVDRGWDRLTDYFKQRQRYQIGTRVL